MKVYGFVFATLSAVVSDQNAAIVDSGPQSPADWYGKTGTFCDISLLDYDDFVVLVESVIGVPEPAGIALFGFGLTLAGLAMRYAKQAQDSRKK